MDKRETDILNGAIAAWRDTSEDETLSGTARANLFENVRGIGDADRASFVPSLTRAWRWAFLGTVPVVAIAAALMVAGDHRPAMGSRLSVAKVDGQVVFTLANGKTDHLVYRSTDPHSFASAAAVKMARNRYTENATGGPALVFYRID